MAADRTPNGGSGNGVADRAGSGAAAAPEPGGTPGAAGPTDPAGPTEDHGTEDHGPEDRGPEGHGTGNGTDEVTSAVVLAIGPAHPTALIRLGGLTVLERAVRTLRAAGVPRVVVAVRAEDRPAAHLIRAHRMPVQVHLTDGPPPALPDGRVLIVAGDQVFDTDAVRALLAEPGTPVLSASTGLAVVDRATALAALDTADGSTAAVRNLVDARHEPGHAARAGLASLVRVPADARRVERALWRRHGPKPTDGLVCRHLNRPLSRLVTLRLLRTRLTPDTLTVTSFLVTLLGAAVVGFAGRWWLLLLGGVLIQAGNVLDGVDGEMARLSVRTSARGALLDTTLDRYADLAVLLGLVLAVGAGPAAWAWGFAATAATLLIPYLNVLCPTAPQRLVRRDVRLLVCALAAAVGLPWWGLIVLAVLGNADVLRVFWVVLRRAPGPE